ncbi:MAG: hypothetical protein J6V90_02200 [Treponema sp.]|nr:hypothetical protein [Treponema sp.]
MKNFKDFKNAGTILSLCALVFALNFSSCDNVSGGSPQAFIPPVIQVQPAAPAAAQQKVIVTIKGAVGMPTAYPAEVSAKVSALAQSVAAPASASENSPEVSRSARPELNTTDDYYYVSAVPQDSSGNAPVYYGKDDQGKFVGGSNGICYEIGLPVGQWTIECGVKSAATDKPVLRGSSGLITLTENDSVVSKSFTAVPVSDAGNGSVLLVINKGSANAITTATASWKNAAGENVVVALVPASTIDSGYGDDVLALNLPSIAPGAYDMTISFYNSDHVMLYQTVQTVGVFSGMKTNSWYAAPGNGDDNNLITGDGFTISPAAVAVFKSSVFYVGDTGATMPGYRGPGDSNEGTFLAPFASLQKAVDTISVLGDGSTDYKIYVSNTVRGNAALSSLFDGKARSLTIEGLNYTAGQSPSDALAGGKLTEDGSPAVLSVATSVPINIKGVKITKAGNLAADKESRGILLDTATSKVTLLEGAEISGHNVDLDGAGVLTRGTLCMKGGVIKDNVASHGGAVWVTGTGTFEMSGSASIPLGSDKKNDVYLAESKTVKVGSLDGSGTVATITPHNWNRNSPVLEAGSSAGATMTSEICGRFAINSEGFSIKKSKIPALQNMGVLAADIFVAPDGDDGDGVEGTKQHPFKTLARAIEELSGGEPETIWVNGTLTANDASELQKIPATLKDGTTAFDTNRCSALTIKGYDSATTYNGVIDANSKGTALTVATSVPVTIENLKITGGKNTQQSAATAYGGGITVSAGSVTLSDRAWITNNKGTGTVGCAGGVGVAPGAKLFMRGTALIGSKDIASAPTSKDDCLNAGGNTCESSSEGGGILNMGSTFIGCDEDGNAGDAFKLAEGYGVMGNWALQYGGGIGNKGILKIGSGEVSFNMADNQTVGVGIGSSSSTGSGGGIYQKNPSSGSAELFICGGKIRGNKAVTGGGVNISSGSAQMSGGTIGGSDSADRNEANLPGRSVNGGGVYIGSSGRLEMTGGTVLGNSASGNGGAVYVYGTFAMSGAPNIPLDSEKKNDVYLASGTTISVGNFDAEPATVATITLFEWKRKTNFLTSSNVITTQTSKFNFTQDNDGWERTIESSVMKSAYINSPIYVVDATDSGNTRPDGFEKGKASGATGTKTSPYASVAAALGCSDLSLADNTITIAGTLTGAQEISSPSANIALKGYKAAGATSSSAMIYAGGGSGMGSSLTVNASEKTVTITDLTISGGTGKNPSGGTSKDGGGIYLDAGTVKLADGAVITGNTVTGNGGGVYLNAPGCELYMSGRALIGDNSTSTTRAESGASNRANQALNGAGIYNNGGKVYIGSNASGTAATGYMLVNNDTDGHYGVRRNYCTGGGKGAGIYHAGGTLLIASGDISHNNAGNAQTASYSGGGIYCAADVTISGGTFTNNYANLGGALYIAAGKKVTIDGAAVFTKNGAHTSGGAVRNEGELAMSAGTIGGSSSDDQNKVTISDTLTTNGGAIYQGGTFEISGSARVYEGSEKINDVYLPYAKTVTVASTTLSGSTSSVATVTPANWNRGTNIIEWGVSPSTEQKTTIKGQIKLSKDDGGWEREEKASGGKNYVCITSPIYVADATYPLSGFGAGKTKANGANGTKSSPYDSIAEALKDTDLASVKKIVVAGTVKGAQTISGTLSTDTLTIEGYTEGGVTSSLNGGFSSTSSTKGRPLTVSSAATVTIQNLAITGGYASGSTSASKMGGGIFVASGAAVNLADGAVVKGNHADNEGGGVYVESGAYFAAYGTSVIGDSSATAAQFYPGADANQAKYGAGIYSQGTLCFGKSINKSGTESGTASWSGGLLGNTAFTSDGGAIWTSGTTNLYDGNIKFNYSLGSGGAIFIAENTSSVTMSGGTIFKNTAYNYGGAVYISSGATFNMSGGTMGGKDASNNDLPNIVTNYSGGAIYQGGTFNISASAYIYPGSEKTNDVYLPENQYVMLGATSLSAYTGTDKLTITPAVWKRGTTFLGGTNVAGNYTKFKCSDSDWSVVQSSTVGVLDADIYVAPTSSTTTVDGITYGKGAAATAGGRGTKAKPYSTIADAVAQCWGGPKDKGTNVSRVINIVGTISGAQEIASTVTTSKASGITLKGVNTDATLNGGMSRTSATKKSTLTLSTAVPVTIQSLKITGGYASGSADADRSGGGIKITAGTVTLSDNAKIYENYVASTSTSGRAKGAGLYVASGARLNISSSSAAIYSNGSDGIDGGGLYNVGTVDMTSGSIYSNRSGSEEDIIGYGGGVDNAGTFYMSGSASIYSNTSNEAGGIYNSGTLYLGRSASNASATLSGSITKNAAKAEDAGTGGGAIYNAVGGTVTMTSGTIGGSAANKNTAVHNGGAILNYGTFTMSGGTISYNEAHFGGGIYNRVLNSSAGEVTLSGGSLSYNKAIRADDYGGDGGGIYTSNEMTMSGGDISGNEANNGGGVYSGDAIVMSGGSIYGNTAAKDGGGVWIDGALYMSKTAVIGNSGAAGYATGSTACSNYAAGKGGGVYATADGAVILGAKAYPWTTSSNQETLSGGIYYNYAGSDGGGIYNEGVDGSYIYTGNINKNASATNGGGICSNLQVFVMSGGTIDGNYARSGGGIYFVGATTSGELYPTLSGGTISNNAVGENGAGGGIYIGARNSLKMSGGTISGNTATASGGRGGGVYIEDSTANLFMSKNALIGDTGTSMAFNTTGEGYSNKAEQGGGIYSNGGGVYIGYKDASNTEAMTSDSYGVHHNSTTGTSGEGGGVYANGGKVKVASGGLSYNFAYKNAGGIYAKTASGNGEISDATIYSNLAGKNGGAVYLDAGCYFNITGGTIRNNTAGRDVGASASNGGGAVYMANDANTTLNISGGTFSSNSVSGSAKGGAIYFRAGKLNISGGAKITTSSTAKENDVYLYSKSCNLQPGQTFNGNGSTTPVAIYLGWDPTAGDAILTGSYAGSHYARFKIIYPVNWRIDSTGKAQQN